jgi:Na+/H+-dicarboxylate symporter
LAIGAARRRHIEGCGLDRQEGTAMLKLGRYQGRRYLAALSTASVSAALTFTLRALSGKRKGTIVETKCDD